MPANPKPGYPVANDADQNDKPISGTTAAANAKHPASYQSGTRRASAAIEYAKAFEEE